jgi:hypothetical protein
MWSIRPKSMVSKGFSMPTQLLLHVTKEFSPVKVPGIVML